MKRFKLLNTIFGWVAFAIAFVTYLTTLEPTASFWDCGEFIATAYKLEVGHPPGAPFFMMTARLFSLFTSDPSKVAVMINTLSALCSALTILFLFWTITHLAKKILIKSEENYTLANIIIIIGAGLVGALAYAFSDTFWFSAVEAEVYAYSSLFTAVAFWLILKWEEKADEPGSDRWLLLIAYLMGLSIGVHLLNLLAIPAIVMVYYYKKYTPSTKGTFLALLVSVVLLAVVLYGVIPGSVQVACWFELFFVNTLGLPFNSGLYVYLFLTIAALAWAIYESYVAKNYFRMTFSVLLAITLAGIPFFGAHIVLGIILIVALAFYFYHWKNKVSSHFLHTSILMITLMLIGYSTYALIVIRSAANPPLDENSPDNVFALKYYLNREQYGDRPLFYGATYNAPVKLRIEGNMCIPERKVGEPMYTPKPKTTPDEKDIYLKTGNKFDYKMDERFCMFFPRMYSSSPNHIQAYKEWGKVKGKQITYDYCGQQKTDVCPTFFENLRFFFNYQLNFMYWRYFLWNFSGRQNDLQGNGEVDKGNWITGINFIDNMLVGNQKNLPTALATNKGHNTYYMLPLLLGILGIFSQIYGGKEGRRGFWTVLLLFFMTGIAIVVYLNQTPYQPRERDYAYAGSFYAFSIWIGLGLIELFKTVNKYLSDISSSILVTLLSLGVPTLMAAQNWDDHDRSERYTARDFGYNYLASCRQNAIIFTNGDNDTFPLWYNQEVEGNRTDVRDCNLSYLQTDWYIDQMKRQAYESDPLPISWKKEDYLSGKNEVVQVEDVIKQPLQLKTVIDFILSTDSYTKIDGEPFIPTKEVYLPIDPEEVLKTGTLKPERANEIISQIDISLKNRLTKSELMVLEMLKENKWERPMYFAVTVGDDYYLGLTDHFELTGLAYQILPIGVKGAGPDVNVDEMYDNVMNKFRFGGVNNPKVYLDENIVRMCKTHRMFITQLAGALIAKNDSVRAKKVLDYCNEMIPGTSVRHDYSSLMMGQYYYQLQQPAKGDKILEQIANDCVEYLNWSLQLSLTQQNSITGEMGNNMAILNEVLRIFDEAERKDLVNKYFPYYVQYSKHFRM